MPAYFRTVNDINDIFTKQMQEPEILEIDYGVVIDIYDAPINNDYGTRYEHNMIIQCEDGEKISTQNNGNFVVGQKVVHLNYVFNRLASANEKEWYKRKNGKNISFIPIHTYKTYDAVEYQKMNEQKSSKHQ